jgi:hypothetical protein
LAVDVVDDGTTAVASAWTSFSLDVAASDGLILSICDTGTYVGGCCKRDKNCDMKLFVGRQIFKAVLVVYDFYC